MKKQEIIAISLAIALFIIGLITGNGEILTLSIFVLPAVLIFPFRNTSPTWLWIIFVLLTLSYGIQTENSFLGVLRTITHWTMLVYAVRKSFFVKKNK